MQRYDTFIPPAEPAKRPKRFFAAAALCAGALVVFGVVTRTTTPQLDTSDALFACAHVEGVERCHAHVVVGAQVRHDGRGVPRDLVGRGLVGERAQR